MAEETLHVGLDDEVVGESRTTDVLRDGQVVERSSVPTQIEEGDMPGQIKTAVLYFLIGALFIVAARVDNVGVSRWWPLSLAVVFSGGAVGTRSGWQDAPWRGQR